MSKPTKKEAHKPAKAPEPVKGVPRGRMDGPKLRDLAKDPAPGAKRKRGQA
jgi:hypothetical protein